MSDTTIRIHPGNLPGDIIRVDANTAVVGVLNSKEQLVAEILDHIGATKQMGKERATQALVKQYAPDEDTAWAWMRQTFEIGDVLWGLDNKAAFEAALTYLPFGWRVAQGSDRLEFRFNSVHKGQYYVIRWRRTKPEGWVCFHAKG